MNDREIAELEKILERHVDEMIESKFGPEPTPQELHWFAQELEEIGDSYGGDPVRYLRADIAWGKAFEAAERVGEASLKEKLAAQYGWSTPVTREAHEATRQSLDEVPVVDSRKALYEIDFDEAVKDVVPPHLRPDDGFGYEL